MVISKSTVCVEQGVLDLGPGTGVEGACTPDAHGLGSGSSPATRSLRTLHKPPIPSEPELLTRAMIVTPRISVPVRELTHSQKYLLSLIYFVAGPASCQSRSSKQNREKPPPSWNLHSSEGVGNKFTHC